MSNKVVAPIPAGEKPVAQAPVKKETVATLPEEVISVTMIGEGSNEVSAKEKEEPTMEMTKDFAIIGVGNCGSQIAWTAEQKYPSLFDCIYVNTSSQDLAMVKSEDSLKIKIGAKASAEGSGKNRSKMKDYLEEDIGDVLQDQQFIDTMVTKKYCFVVCSAAGGTGSGAGPVLMAILQQVFPDTNFILVVVLNQIASSIMEQGNALEFMQELFGDAMAGCTYMVYDNEKMSHLPNTKCLESVNQEVVEDLRVLTGVDNYATPYESIDSADQESILTTPGRLLVCRVTKGLTEKALEDNDLDEMIIKAIKNGAHAETDRNKRVIRWGVITYLTEAANRLYDSHHEKLQEFLGTPVERFNHNAINPNGDDSSFIYLIASGMSPINDRVHRITERIEELENALASEDADKFIMSGAGASYDVMEARRKESRKARASTDVNPADIFQKFRK